MGGYALLICRSQTEAIGLRRHWRGWVYRERSRARRVTNEPNPADGRCA